jgi:hypothetical protein
MHDAPSLIFVRVRDAIRYLWKDNPKRHDLTQIQESIKRHGFQDVPKFDVHLEPREPGLEGPTKPANGRIEALDDMETSGRFDLPRGLALEKGTGTWCLPLIIGTDAASRAMARAYAIDANNLTMAGFTPEQQAGMWDTDQYLALIQQALDDEAMPVSLTDDQAHDLLDAIQPKDEKEEGKPEFEISPELLERHDYVVIYCDNELDWNVLSELLELKRMASAPVGGKTLAQRGLGRVVPAQKLFSVINVDPTRMTPELESLQDVADVVGAKKDD